jgi:hypothetical protein
MKQKGRYGLQMDDIFLQYPVVEDMDRGELEDFIEDLDLDIDPLKYKSVKKLRNAVLDLLGLD